MTDEPRSAHTAKQKAEKWLTLLLRLNGALLLLALPTVFLPVSTMNQIHQALGMGEFPDQPIAQYLARSTSALYAVHGAVTLLIAIAPRRHWSLIGPLACLHIFLGAVLFVTDLTAGMPWFWTAVEGIPIALFGCLLLALWRAAEPR